MKEDPDENSDGFKFSQFLVGTVFSITATSLCGGVTTPLPANQRPVTEGQERRS